MTDEELIAAFESTALPAEQFSHATHVRVAWWYLRQSPLPTALGRFTAALRRFNRRPWHSGQSPLDMKVASRAR